METAKLPFYRQRETKWRNVKKLKILKRLSKFHNIKHFSQYISKMEQNTEENLESNNSVSDVNIVNKRVPAVTDIKSLLSPCPNPSILWKCSLWNVSESLESNISNDVLGDNSMDLDICKETIGDDVLPVDTWLLGGPLGSRNAILIFRSSALANATDASIQNKPAFKLHITYKVLQAETKLLAKLLECHGVTEVANNSSDFNILWTGSHPKPGMLRCLAHHQRVNHFPRSYELTRKDRLYKNIEKMQHLKGYKHFDFIPQTFVMPGEYKDLCTTHHRIKGPWIVKPVASSRGRGIYIVETPNQVPLEEPVVVAKYISKPLLVEGHKCDLRLYVAVTCFDPLLIYIYEEGMVRFATVKYDASHKSLWNPCMHLCNYSINKYHSDYIKSDDPCAENVGHKWTLSALIKHLKSLGKDTAYLMSQVEDLVVKSILCSGNSIVSACKMFVPTPSNCFELYGFDILVDETLKPWLLEINLSPSLGCDSPLDVRLKSAMLADLLTLVGIPAIDPMLRPSTTTISSNSSKASTNLKMKFSGYRRVHSADGLSNTLPRKSSNTQTHNNNNNTLTSSTLNLSPEEARLVKMAKSQFERRGGFVRIFPTVDSWSKYCQYLDTITGVPLASGVTSSYNLSVTHNFNLLMFNQLFPNVPSTTTIKYNDRMSGMSRSLDRKHDLALVSSISLQRQDRYERKLRQGHRAALTPKKELKDSRSMELKKQICDMIKTGKRLTPSEARRTFSQYLNCVLHKIVTANTDEGQIDVVLKFLQRASTYLKTPFAIKCPSHKLSEKDRAAVIAKQLNDFIYLYNRETELYADLSRPNQLSNAVFSEFLETAGENDLEEILYLQAVPMKGKDSAPSFQGILKCLPNVSGSFCFRSSLNRANRRGVKVSPLS
ncbi:Tubulin-tyrosine ligase family [Popillia japonica]|uniref:Tubulin--tyrosine ligase-like protein 5 n=1 Tax=Popillia japonica TaxID=7064 RepID=A0AAW1JIN4_POPJA